LPWPALIEPVVKDLKATTSNGFWWAGRKIRVRIHLGAYLLQLLYNLTDRKVEYQLKDNAAFQLFCGLGIVEDWHAPDHTKIAIFRNRLSPETHRHLANMIAQTAVSLGFADPRETDFDSTVQEANVSYPSDASLMTKLAGLGKKLVGFVKEKLPRRMTDGLDVNMKAIKETARDYFFLAKNKGIEIKREAFKKLHKLVKHEMKPVVDLSEMLTVSQVAKLPWNIRRAYEQIKSDAWRYLLDVAHFTRTHTIKAGKILSFHAKALASIKKGKVGKELEFGRVFQLGRIKGNFLFVLESQSVEMNDKQNFIPLLREHARLFGENALDTVATDKGYWSSKNRQELQRLGKRTEGLQKPATIKETAVDLDLQERLRNRRAGIEPLIGHVKHGGQIGRSRMKSDQATQGAAYGSVLGLNLRQLVRHQQGKMKDAA
jgi:IS5 family transposase